MRIFPLPVFAILLCLPGLVALAADTPEFSGTPVLLPSGVLMIDGRDVTLWGIDGLAGDQQCWHEDRAWDCGEQALIALRHHLTGRPVRCVTKSSSGADKVNAQCFRQKDGKEDDLARYLVAEGWARDRSEDSKGLYASDQDGAIRDHRGIWTSRFQTAEDWKNGVPHYVEYKMAPPKPSPGSGDEKN